MRLGCAQKSAGPRARIRAKKKRERERERRAREAEMQLIASSTAAERVRGVVRVSWRSYFILVKSLRYLCKRSRVSYRIKIKIKGLLSRHNKNKSLFFFENSIFLYTQS